MKRTNNSRVTLVKKAPKLTTMEAFDRLPLEIRQALWEGPTQWNAHVLLHRYRKVCSLEGHEAACRQAVIQIRLWNRIEIADATPYNAPHSRRRTSPHLTAKATMQMSGLAKAEAAP